MGTRSSTSALLYFCQVSLGVFAAVAPSDASAMNASRPGLTADYWIHSGDASSIELNLGGAVWRIDVSENRGIELVGATQGYANIELPNHLLEWNRQGSLNFVGSRPEWASDSISEPKVLWNPIDAHWMMFFRATHGETKEQSIGLVFSDDGQTWDLHDAKQILRARDLGASIATVGTPSAVVGESGDIDLFFTQVDSDGVATARHWQQSVGRPWEDLGVALAAGTEGSFDEHGVRVSDVLLDAQGDWHLFYNGISENLIQSQGGLAWSRDAQAWTKSGRMHSAERSMSAGSAIVSAYGIEHWWGCGSRICYSQLRTQASDRWDDHGPMLDVSDFGDFVFGKPSVVLHDGQYQLWIEESREVGLSIGHYVARPAKNRDFDLHIAWSGEHLLASVDGGPPLIIEAIDRPNFEDAHEAILPMLVQDDISDVDIDAINQWRRDRGEEIPEDELGEQADEHADEGSLAETDDEGTPSSEDLPDESPEGSDIDNGDHAVLPLAAVGDEQGCSMHRSSKRESWAWALLVFGVVGIRLRRSAKPC